MDEMGQPSIVDLAAQQTQQEQQAALPEQYNPVSGFFQQDPIDAEIAKKAQELGVDPSILKAKVVQAQQQQQQQPQMPQATVAESELPASAFAPVEASTPKPNAQGAGTKNPIEESYAKEQAAYKAAADAGALKAQENAAYLRKMNAQMAEEHKNQLAKRQEIEQMTNNQVQKLQGIESEMQNYKFTDYWADKSASQKIMAGIAIALGGMGAAKQGVGATNKGLEVINQAIDRDLSLQKLNFEKLKQSGEMSSNIYARMNQQFDNSIQAEAATRLYMTQAAQNKLAELSAKYEAPELQAKAQIMNEQLERQKLGEVAKFKEQAQINAVLNGTPDTTGTDIRNLTPTMVQQISKYRPNFDKRYVPGYGEATSEKARDEFEKLRADLEPALAGSMRILEASKNLNRITDLSKRAQISSEVKALAGQLRVPLTGPGAMTEKEYERLMDAVGDPTSLAALPSLQRVKLQTIMKKLQSDLTGAAARAGLKTQQKPSDTDLKRR